MPKSGKPLSVFLDANIIFSAAYSPEGRSAVLFALARKKLCRLTSSRYAVTEAHRNIAEKKPEVLKTFSKLLTFLKIFPEASAKRQKQVASLGLNEFDVPILAAAIGHTEILVTGDKKHFGQWMGQKVYGVRVLSLADTLNLLLSK